MLVLDAPTPREHCENQRGILLTNLYTKIIKKYVLYVKQRLANVFFHESYDQEAHHTMVGMYGL